MPPPPRKPTPLAPPPRRPGVYRGLPTGLQDANRELDDAELKTVAVVAPKPGVIRFQLNSAFSDEAELQDYIKRNCPGAVVVKRWTVERFCVEVESTIERRNMEHKKKGKK